jgi:dipeptidyl aminopeptidase/acylaminoacyl peptidase
MRRLLPDLSSCLKKLADTVLHVAGFSPRFSTVNDYLAFREPTTGHIHLIRPDSSADRDLQVDGYPLSWSPEGKRIAFEGNAGIYMVNPDGSHLSRIGPADVEVTDLAWSADGRGIAYVVRTSSGPESVYLARADDSDRRAVVTAEGVRCLTGGLECAHLIPILPGNRPGP